MADVVVIHHTGVARSAFDALVRSRLRPQLARAEIRPHDSGETRRNWIEGGKSIPRHEPSEGGADSPPIVSALRHHRS